MNSASKIITASMLAIGDELLSGRTKDKNIGHLASFLTTYGIDLKEVRIVSDDEDDIVHALNALRERYDLVFTSGGIGPTHDDITADSVAKAFNIEISHDPRAMKILGDYYAEREIDFTTARKRMARIPHGAELIENKISKAPGFILENVYVMAGVPSIFQAMLDAVSPSLPSGHVVLSEAVDCSFGEGTIGDALSDIQQNHLETSIGSYPKFDGVKYSTQIVIRSRNEENIAKAKQDIIKMLNGLE